MNVSQPGVRRNVLLLEIHCGLCGFIAAIVPPAFIVVCLASFSAVPFDAQMGWGAEICIR